MKSVGYALEVAEASDTEGSIFGGGDNLPPFFWTDKTGPARSCIWRHAVLHKAVTRQPEPLRPDCSDIPRPAFIASIPSCLLSAPAEIHSAASLYSNTVTTSLTPPVDRAISTAFCASSRSTMPIR